MLLFFFFFSSGRRSRGGLGGVVRLGGLGVGAVGVVGRFVAAALAEVAYC